MSLQLLLCIDPALQIAPLVFEAGTCPVRSEFKTVQDFGPLSNSKHLHSSQEIFCLSVAPCHRTRGHWIRPSISYLSSTQKRAPSPHSHTSSGCKDMTVAGKQRHNDHRHTYQASGLVECAFLMNHQNPNPPLPFCLYSSGVEL